MSTIPSKSQEESFHNRFFPLKWAVKGEREDFHCQIDRFMANLYHYFNKDVCLSIRPSVFPWFRHKNFFSPNQQMLLIDVVTYASVMTKMCSASSRDPPGALGGPKRARGGHAKSWSNEKMLITKVVTYASVMKKCPKDHPRPIHPPRALPSNPVTLGVRVWSQRHFCHHWSICDNFYY